MSSVLPARRLFSALVAALTLLVGAPILTGVAQASHSVGTVSPTGGQNNSTTTVTVNGSGFNPATASVRLERVSNRNDDITGTVNALGSSSSQLAVSFNLALANPGLYDVFVTQPGEISGPADVACAGCFTIVRDQNPAINDISPDTSTSAINDLIVKGLGITKGATIRFLLPGTQNEDTGLVFTRTTSGSQDSTTIRGTYAMTNSFTPGLHDLGLVDPDSGLIVAICSGCFKQPRIDTVDPSALGQGATSKDLIVVGSGLAGSVVSFSPSSGISIISQSTQSDNQITVRVTISGSATPGGRSVTVVHSDGGFFTKANGLTINSAPEIDSVNRSTIGQGAVEVVITATGSGFQPGLVFSIPGLSVTESTYVSPTQGTFKLSVPAGTPIGPRDLSVSNPDFGTDTLSPGITITTGPVVTEVTPPSAAQGATSFPVVIKGSGFSVTGVTVLFGNGSDIFVNTAVAQPGGETINATITVLPTASGGLRQVRVTNNGDRGSGVCAAPGCFGINTIGPINPGAHSNSAGTKTITITKATGGLTNGSTVQLIRNGAQPGEPAITGTVTGATGNTLTVNLDLFRAGPGLYNVQVTTGSVIDSCSGCFTVTGSTPTLTDLSPNTASRGAPALPISVTGTNLSRGGQLLFKTGPLPTAPNEPRLRIVPGSYNADLAPNTITAKLEVDPTLTSGTVYYLFYDDGSSGTDPSPVTCGAPPATNCQLTITDPPSFRATSPITPNRRGQGAASALITVVGDEFDASTTFDFGPGVTVQEPYDRTGVNTSTPGSDDTIKVPVVVSIDATPGARNVVVTTGSGGQATCTGCFTVSVAPSVSNLAPGSGRAGQTLTGVKVNGANFQSGATVDAGPGIAVSQIQFVNSGQLSATFTISSGASNGPRDIAVTNPDGGVGVGLNAFRIVQVPGTPGTPTATAGDRSVTVTWTHASNGGGTISGYTITCSTGSCTPLNVAGNVTSAVMSNLKNGTTYAFKVTATNEVGSGPASLASNAVTPLGPDGEFIPVAPFRVFDTRTPANAPKVGPGTANIRTVQITGKGGTTNSPLIPRNGVSAVVLNVTVANGTSASNLRVYPADGAVPTTGTISFRAGDVAANLTQVNVASGGASTGAVKVYNHAGTVNVILDVVGYFSDGRQGSPDGDRLVEAGPRRIVDTRTNTGTTGGPLVAKAAPRTLDIGATPEVPADATAVVVNLTVANASTSGFVTLFPADAPLASVSNINFRANQVIANLAVVKLGDGGGNEGKIKAYAGLGSGTVNVILDIVGYYAPGTGGTMFKGVSPTRLVNTFASPPVGGTRLGPNAVGTFKITGVGPVPATSAVKSVVVAVQATAPERAGWLRVWPNDESEPTTSVVNFLSGRHTLNLVVAEVDGEGRIKIRNGSPGRTHIIIDVVGYYIDQPPG